MTAAELNRKTMNAEQAREFLGYKNRCSVYRALESGLLEGYRNGVVKGVRVYAASVEELKRSRMIDGY